MLVRVKAIGGDRNDRAKANINLAVHQYFLLCLDELLSAVLLEFQARF
jgi:hypothetical protein